MPPSKRPTWRPMRSQPISRASTAASSSCCWISGLKTGIASPVSAGLDFVSVLSIPLSTSSLYDRRPGDRNDEFAAALAVLRLLSQDLVGEIPGEQQCVVRLVFAQSRRVEDLQAVNRKSLALFVQTPIDHVLQVLLPDAAVTRQRDTLGGCAIGGNARSAVLQFIQHAAQRSLQLRNSGGESCIRRIIEHLPCLLSFQQFLDTAVCRAPSAWGNTHPEGAAVNPLRLHTNHVQPASST